jgi:transposase
MVMSVSINDSRGEVHGHYQDRSRFSQERVRRARGGEAGRVQLTRTVRRAQLLEVLAAVPPCIVAMEACSGAHHWARQLVALGHTPRVIAPKFVAPYRMSGKQGKNDAHDAAAICEAAGRPNMRFVPMKTTEQQALLSVHRVRQGFVEERTATVNRLRGLLSEFGVVLPLKAVTVRRQAAAHLDRLPVLAQRALGDLLAHLAALDGRLEEYDTQLKLAARHDERARRLMNLRGVGPVGASAIVATIGAAHEFRNGRQFAAWLGMVPRQYSSGGKARLGRITKAGDAYLRTLLIMGARAVLAAAAGRTDRISRWALALRARRGYMRAVVAIAAKNARLAWAMLRRGEDFRLREVTA